MTAGRKFSAHGHHGLGSISSLKRWRVTARENLQWNLDCIITLIFLAVVLVLLLTYSLLFILPTTVLSWVARHLGLERHEVF